MKFLNCCEVCDVKCDFVASGKSEREIIRNMFYHGEQHHRELLNNMNDYFRQKITKRMHALVKEG